MVPLGTVMDLKDITDADRINRYNLYPSAEINGAGVPGVSSGQAIDIMANLAEERPARRLTPTSGPNWPTRKKPPATPRCSSSRCACCSSS